MVSHKFHKRKGHRLLTVSLVILLHAVLLEQIVDLYVRIDDLADRNVVIDSFNEVCDVL